MSEKDDGGQAFPTTGLRADDGILYAPLLGMTLRDYFAAVAPEASSWFKPAMPNDRPKCNWVADEGGKVYGSAYEAEKECGDCHHDANAEAAREWDDEYNKQREIQWPYVWADFMLAERSK